MELLTLQNFLAVFSGFSAVAYGILTMIGVSNLLHTPTLQETLDPLMETLVGPTHPKIFRFAGFMLMLDNIGVVLLAVYSIFGTTSVIPDIVWTVTAVFALYLAFELGRYIFSNVSPEDWVPVQVHRRVMWFMIVLLGWNTAVLVTSYILQAP